MRIRTTLLLGLACVAACGGDKAATADSTKTAAPAAAAMVPAPAALTAEMVAGTWTGTNMTEKGDSVVGHFTAIGAGGTGKLLAQGSKDTVLYTMVFAGDSMTATSSAYNDVTLPKGAPKVTFVSVGRMVGAKLVGTSALHLESRPDSLIGRGKWEATKAP